MTAPTRPVSRPPVPAPAPLSAVRIVVLALGALVAVTGLAFVATGGALAMTALGRSGYVSSGDAPLRSDSYAISGREIGVNVRAPDVVAGRDVHGRVRVRATGDDPTRPLFVGIGRRADVDGYLTGVRNDEVRDFDLVPFGADYRRHDGGAPATPPGDQTFWAVSDSGTGTRELLWDVAPGEWSVVVMNADASAGVAATVDLGVSLPVLRLVPIGLLVAGGSALVVGAVVVALAVGTRPRSPYTAVPVEPAR